MIKVPILDRLSFRDYQGLFITILFFIVEGFIRIIVMFMPKFLISTFKLMVDILFPWISRIENAPHVSPLEKAQSFEKMVAYWKNYNCEQHIVRTKDDYLLCVHRIPSVKRQVNVDKIINKRRNHYKNHTSRLEKNNIQVVDNLDQFIRESLPNTDQELALTTQTYHSDSSTIYSNERFTGSATDRKRRSGKPVVLLYHGFLMSSEIWVTNTEEFSNLPFILAQKGYDVWLGNARGNKYSQYHVYENPRNQPFWNFSLNEFATRDLPDTVDYILAETGAASLTYIGFSQGTAQAFAGLSVNSDLNRKVNLFIAMAPATTPKGLSNPLIDAFVKATPTVIYLIFGRKTPLKLALFWQRILSPPLFVKVIDASVGFLFGWTGHNMTMDQKTVSYQHLYSVTSVKSLVHWFQIIRSGQFHMYDEVPSRLPYHTVNTVADHIPPRFPTLQIKTPIAIFYGGTDSLVDFDVLAADLPSPLAYVKSIQKWEHLDFLWGDGIEYLVYPDILKLLQIFNPRLPPPSENSSAAVPLMIMDQEQLRMQQHEDDVKQARQQQQQQRNFKSYHESAPRDKRNSGSRYSSLLMNDDSSLEYALEETLIKNNGSNVSILEEYKTYFDYKQ
ncbi:Alpha/Beta hydrolase protein [Mycotypha africana]|uniref:Alpha/Beta hydrolase protein n=1 Tax=Mycotypha africana TaxID=64632 RepID=UPI0023005DCD|nr:Alpha/Beta hydrolase protein [Mycotypha africana]KAI8992188.1 Alpha/Beta hydrolase protein [Mycotypha africana]